MALHIIGLVWTYVLAAIFTTSVSLVPAATAWGSMWTWVAFAVFILPGYSIGFLISAALLWLIPMIVVGSVGTVLFGGAALVEYLGRKLR